MNVLWKLRKSDVNDALLFTEPCGLYTEHSSPSDIFYHLIRPLPRRKSLPYTMASTNSGHIFDNPHEDALRSVSLNVKDLSEGTYANLQCFIV